MLLQLHPQARVLYLRAAHISFSLAPLFPQRRGLFVCLLRSLPMLLFWSVVSSEFASIAHYDGLSTAYECSHNSTIAMVPADLCHEIGATDYSPYTYLLLARMISCTLRAASTLGQQSLPLHECLSIATSRYTVSQGCEDHT